MTAPSETLEVHPIAPALTVARRAWLYRVIGAGTGTTCDTNPPYTGIPYEGPPLDGFVTITWEEP